MVILWVARRDSAHILRMCRRKIVNIAPENECPLDFPNKMVSFLLRFVPADCGCSFLIDSALFSASPNTGQAVWKYRWAAFHRFADFDLRAKNTNLKTGGRGHHGSEVFTEEFNVNQETCVISVSEYLIRLVRDSNGTLWHVRNHFFWGRPKLHARHF